MNVTEGTDAANDGITVWRGVQLGSGWWGKAISLVRSKRTVDVKIEGSFLFDFAVYVAPFGDSDPSENLLRGKRPDTWLRLCDGNGYSISASDGPSMQALFLAANPTENYFLVEAFKQKVHAVCILGMSLITHKPTSYYCSYAQLAEYKDKSSPDDGVSYAEYTIILEDDAHLSEGIVPKGARGKRIHGYVRWLRWLSPLATPLGVAIGIPFGEPLIGGVCGAALFGLLKLALRTKVEPEHIEEKGGDLPC